MRMLSQLTGYVENSVDPDLTESVKTVVGGAYAGLVLKMVTENPAIVAVIVGTSIIVFTFMLFKIMSYSAKTKRETSNQQESRSAEQLESTARTVGNLQLRETGSANRRYKTSSRGPDGACRHR